VIRTAGADERRWVGRSDGGFLDATSGYITRVGAPRTGNKRTTRLGRSPCSRWRFHLSDSVTIQAEISGVGCGPIPRTLSADFVRAFV
jgi:hypothetical protein